MATGALVPGFWPGDGDWAETTSAKPAKQQDRHHAKKFRARTFLIKLGDIAGMVSLVKPHAIIPRTRVGRSAHGLGRAIVNPLRPVCRSHNGRLRLQPVLGDWCCKELCNCFREWIETQSARSRWANCAIKRNTERPVLVPLGRGQIRYSTLQPPYNRVGHGYGQTGGKNIPARGPRLIGVEGGAVNHVRIAAVRANGVIQPIGQARHDNAGSSDGIRADIGQPNGLFHQPRLRIVSHRGVIGGDQLTDK